MSTQFDDMTVPFSALNGAADGVMTLPVTGAMSAETLSSLLMRVMHVFASGLAAEQGVTPVSVTLDVTGPLPIAGTLTFTPNLDRQTRTIIFAGGEAMCDGASVLTATAVYRIS